MVASLSGSSSAVPNSFSRKYLNGFRPTAKERLQEPISPTPINSKKPPHLPPLPPVRIKPSAEETTKPVKEHDVHPMPPVHMWPRKCASDYPVPGQEKKKGDPIFVGPPVRIDPASDVVGAKDQIAPDPARDEYYPGSDESEVIKGIPQMFCCIKSISMYQKQLAMAEEMK